MLLKVVQTLLPGPAPKLIFERWWVFLHGSTIWVLGNGHVYVPLLTPLKLRWKAPATANGLHILLGLRATVRLLWSSFDPPPALPPPSLPPLPPEMEELPLLTIPTLTWPFLPWNRMARWWSPRSPSLTTALGPTCVLPITTEKL